MGSSERMNVADGIGNHRKGTRRETVGWSDCDCGAPDYRPGKVLDPFAGTGTTLAVADLHDRDAIGIDLDPKNPTLYEERHKEVKRALFGYKDTNVVGQINLFETEHNPQRKP